jgi:hypothetical protein
MPWRSSIGQVIDFTYVISDTSVTNTESSGCLISVVAQHTCNKYYA